MNNLGTPPVGVPAVLFKLSRPFPGRTSYGLNTVVGLKGCKVVCYLRHHKAPLRCAYREHKRLDRNYINKKACWQDTRMRECLISSQS